MESVIYNIENKINYKCFDFVGLLHKNTVLLLNNLSRSEIGIKDD